MPSPECKVYFDGSHYIAIPHTTRRYKPRPKKNEEKIIVKPPNVNEDETEKGGTVSEISPTEIQEGNTMSEGEIGKGGTMSEYVISGMGTAEQALTPIERIAREGTPISDAPSPPTVSAPSGILNEQGDVRIMTKRELFNEVYRECVFLRFKERKARLLKAMRPYFKTDDAAKVYVESNLERKKRNLIARRIRLTRKANLQDFNYFVTVTYDSAKHTEESFRKKLKSCLGHFCTRKEWRYIGVWERSPEKQRLHFHGIFRIPDGTMSGYLFEKKDYNFKSHRRTSTVQNSYFNERFGRSDFEKIVDNVRIGDALVYIMKYIEKSGEKIVYSKGLPQYFISDIMDEDVVCPCGLEDKKLLLYDDFTCLDEGEYIGTVGEETIKRLRKAN